MVLKVTPWSWRYHHGPGGTTLVLEVLPWPWRYSQGPGGTTLVLKVLPWSWRYHWKYQRGSGTYPTARLVQQYLATPTAEEGPGVGHRPPALVPQAPTHHLQHNQYHVIPGNTKSAI